MKKRVLPVPEQRDFEAAYLQAYQLASEQFARLGDIGGQCQKSGADCSKDCRLISLSYLGKPYTIKLPGIDISAEDIKKVPLRDGLLILHYLLRADGCPLSGHLITFKELPEGAIYSPNFYKRAVKPLLDKFGREPELLVEAARKMGGSPADMGDVSVKIKGFPNVPLIIVMWCGDSELEPEASILFDDSINCYLDTEDITVLCQTMSLRLAGIRF